MHILCTTILEYSRVPEIKLIKIVSRMMSRMLRGLKYVTQRSKNSVQKNVWSLISRYDKVHEVAKDSWWCKKHHSAH